LFGEQIKPDTRNRAKGVARRYVALN
jgi:hypothetical protein